MNNLLEELESYFKSFINDKAERSFHNGLISYLQFIEDTVPFHEIAHKILFPRPEMIVLSPIKDFYRATILRDGQNIVFPITPNTIDGSGLFLFHKMLNEGAGKVGLSRRQEVILQTAENDKKICLSGKPMKCYSFKRENPQRFLIVIALLKTESGKSAREIANALNKDGANKIVQDNIKKEIGNINKLFKEHAAVKDNLISKVESGGKNIYFLNRDRFSFSKEK